MENPSELLTESGDKSRDQFNNWIAVSVAILAAFMAVTKVKDDNIVQAMLQAKSDAVDSWNEYQSKRIKHHLVELGHDQATAMLAVTALARKRWLLWTSLVFAAFGVAMGLAGLLGLPLHPNWLSKLLS